MPERALDCRDRALERSDVGDVGRLEANVRTPSLLSSAARAAPSFLRMSTKSDLRLLRGECAHDRLADAAGAAGDEHRLAGKARIGREGTIGHGQARRRRGRTASLAGSAVLGDGQCGDNRSTFAAIRRRTRRQIHAEVCATPEELTFSVQSSDVSGRQNELIGIENDCRPREEDVSEGHGQRRAALASRPIAAAESIGRRIVSGSWKPGSIAAKLRSARRRVLGIASLRARGDAGARGEGPRRLKAAARHHRAPAQRLEPPRPGRARLADRRGSERRLCAQPFRGARDHRAGGGGSRRDACDGRGAGRHRAGVRGDGNDASAIAGIDRGRRRLPPGDPDRHRQRFHRRVRAGDRNLAHHGIRRAARGAAGSRELRAATRRHLRRDQARRCGRRARGLPHAADARGIRRHARRPRPGQDR